MPDNIGKWVVSEAFLQRRASQASSSILGGIPLFRGLNRFSLRGILAPDIPAKILGAELRPLGRENAALWPDGMTHLLPSVPLKTAPRRNSRMGKSCANASPIRVWAGHSRMG